MMEAAPQSDRQDVAALRAAVDAELARDGAALRFPPMLEKRYEADRAAPRASELRRLVAAAAVGYPLMTLFLHFVVARRRPALAMVVELMLFLPSIAIARRVLARPGLSAVARESVALALCSSCWWAGFSTSRWRRRTSS